VFVTTPGVFSAWLASRFDQDSTPHDPFAALTLDYVYTPIFDIDAAVSSYARLPVSSTRRHVIAALLIHRAQDYCLTCSPGTLLISASVGKRLFVIDAPARDTIPVPERCQREAKADDRAQRAIAGYYASGLKDSELFDQYTQAEDEQFANLRQCYDADVRSDPRISHLVAQAQTLLDKLPDR